MKYVVALCLMLAVSSLAQAEEPLPYGVTVAAVGSDVVVHMSKRPILFFAEAIEKMGFTPESIFDANPEATMPFRCGKGTCVREFDPYPVFDGKDSKSFYDAQSFKSRILMSNGHGSTFVWKDMQPGDKKAIQFLDGRKIVLKGAVSRIKAVTQVIATQLATMQRYEKAVPPAPSAMASP